MELLLERVSSGTDDTLGVLFELQGEGPIYTNKFLCFTLEDEYRAMKIKGETRIPSGRYEIKLRTVGGTHEKYLRAYPSMHLGMLWLQDVPNFQFILLHIGNTDEDTDGCVLLGDDVSSNISRSGSISRSKDAYLRVYPPIAAALHHGEKVWITVIDRS